jgi:hypothetical protein
VRGNLPVMDAAKDVPYRPSCRELLSCELQSTSDAWI